MSNLFSNACVAIALKQRNLEHRSSRWLIAALAIVALSLTSVAFGQSGFDPGDFVLEYTGSNGNLSLIFLGTGSSGAGPVSIQSLNVITLGDTSSSNPAMPSGIPGVTPGTGGLNTGTATLPPASFTVLNTSSSGVNGIYSEIFNANVGTTWRTFDLTNPGVSDRLNIGNVAATGWSLSNLSTIFMTNPDVYGSYNFGKFAYSYADGNALYGAVVPEPSSMVTLGIGAIFGLVFRKRFANAK